MRHQEERPRPPSGNGPDSRACRRGRSRASTTDRVFLAAAGCAFYATLALFPAINMLISIYGLVLDPATAEQQLTVLAGLPPPPDYGLIEDRIHQLIGQQGSVGAAVGVMLWFHVSAYAVLLGAELNAGLEEVEVEP